MLSEPCAEKAQKIKKDKVEMIMTSGWIVTYIDGESVIMSEKAFAEHDISTDKESVETEVHYFDIQDAIKKHPLLEVIS